MQVFEDYRIIEVAIPKAARVLQNLQGVATFEGNYGTRHPFAAYNISLTTIARRLISVLENLEPLEVRVHHENNQTAISDELLLEAMDHLLDSLMEHMDVCGGILRSFFASPDEKRFKKVFADFKTSVEPYRKHIGGIDNYIKHNQGKLRSVFFSWLGGACLGYFVEGPVGNGILGPVGKIHSGENTAFSFNRDIPYHLCSVFAIGARLANALHAIDRRLVVLPLPKMVEGQYSDWCKALQMVAGLPKVFFPDEVVKGVPKVHLNRDRLTIEYPAQHQRVTGPPSPSKISLSYGGDGVTRSFKVPYFNEEN
jgi:hypothetical protein